MQSYQRFQCIGHTVFNTSGTNAPCSLSLPKAGTHSAFGEKSHTAAHRAKQGPSLPRPQHGLVLPAKSLLFCHAFIYIHFPVLCVPHYQQQFYLRPSFITFFNFSHKRPTFAFTSESGYTLGFAQRIAHNGSHAETGGISDGALSLPSTRTAHSRTSPGRVPERRALPLLGLGRGCSQRTQRAFGTAMRLCASLSRGVAAPLGCVIFSVSVEIAACMPCAQGLSVCARRGVVSLPSARFTCC